MVSVADFRDIYEYNWRVLRDYGEALAKLPEDELLKNREATHESLKNIFHHILSVHDGWLNVTAQGASADPVMREKDFDEVRSMEPLRGYLEKIIAKEKRFLAELESAQFVRSTCERHAREIHDRGEHARHDVGVDLRAVRSACVRQEEAPSLDHEDVLDFVADLLRHRERLEFSIEDAGGRLVQGRGIGTREQGAIARGHEVPHRVQEAHDPRGLQVIREIFDSLEHDDGLRLRRDELAHEELEQLRIRRRDAVLADRRRKPEDRSGLQVVVVADLGRRAARDYAAQRPESDRFGDREERQPRPPFPNRVRVSSLQVETPRHPDRFLFLRRHHEHPVAQDGDSEED